MKRTDGRTPRLILLLLFALTAVACMPAVLIPVNISGRVVVEGGPPLADHEVELWTLRVPALPIIGMGSYVKKTTVRTDANGLFSLSTKVPRNRPFELRTNNPDSVYGGGSVNLDPASSISDVTIVHRMGLDERRRKEPR